MVVITKEESPSLAYYDTVQEITRIYRILPPRPSIEEVEAARSVLETVDTEEKVKLEEISKQEVPQNVPEELFSVLQQFRKTMVLFQSRQDKKTALDLVELDGMFQSFDDLIQRASLLVSGDTQNQKQAKLNDPVEEIDKDVIVQDEGLVKRKEDNKELNLVISSSRASSSFSAGEEGSEKLSLMKVAALVEKLAKSGEVVVDLRGKLVDAVEWLPVSIGKLSKVTELVLSENKIMALPPTLGNLKALTKLDIHSNQVINLPSSFGELINLADLDLHANRLKSLPASFRNLSNLVNLDLSSNSFSSLPEIIGSLTRLKRLNVEANDLEEMPYTIGNCSSLLELKLDFNQLKALPEAIGRLENLEILTLHYNRIKGFPTTIGNLINLKELDASFNELESIPENLCFATSLKKLNIGNNFADLRALPRSIGNLEMLEDLDISYDQIWVLPDSFRLLSKLRIFRTEETPLEAPPKQVIKLGAQAVVKYMDEFATKRDSKSLQSKKKKRFLFRFCSIFCLRRM